MRGKAINMHSNLAKKFEERQKCFQPVYFGEFTHFREYGQQKQFTASQILWHFITTYFTFKDKVLLYTLLLFGLCVLLMKTLISNGYFRSRISWWGVTGFRRWSQCVCVCVDVMSAAPGRLCSTSHTVHTPSQSLYHSPASENKQEPLICNCKQKLCGQA